MKKKVQNSKSASGYRPGDDVFVATPRPSDKWGTAFRGEVVAAHGKTVIVSDGDIGWDVPLTRLRRPSFAFCSEDDSVVTSLDSYSATDRTDFLCRLTDMVVNRVSPSLIIAGDPGIGKTFNVRDRFHLKGMSNGDGYYLVKGRVMGLGLYKLLYEANGQIIIFDDSDSVLEDKDSVNILKGALDSYGERLISWHTLAAGRAGLPECFIFTGAAIFISNRDMTRIDSAVRSRSFRLNFTMNNDEVLDVLENIYPTMEPDVSGKLKDETFRFLSEIRDEKSKISFRTMINAIRLRVTNPDKWQEMTLLFA